MMVQILLTSNRYNLKLVFVECVLGSIVMLYGLVSLDFGTWLELELTHWNAVCSGKSRCKVC